LFSLEGLLETERERVRREAREAERRRDEEMVRIAEQASRRRLALEQEQQARARREALERERERLDNERIDAMKQAAVERARVEAEGQLRLLELEQARKHELSLSQLNERSRTARYRSLTWLSSAAFALAIASGASLYFGYLAPASAQAEQRARALADANARLADGAQRALRAEQAKGALLGERVRQLEAVVPVPVAQAPAAPQPIQRPPGVRPPHGPSGGKQGGCQDTGDPLDKCLR
jgi:colicin import membrane protein